MKAADALKALEGQENVLQPAIDDHERFFHNLSCPSCGGEVMPIVNTRRLFSTGSVLPNYLAKCKNCGVEFEPYTGIQITMPSVEG